MWFLYAPDHTFPMPPLSRIVFEPGTGIIRVWCRRRLRKLVEGVAGTVQ